MGGKITERLKLGIDAIQWRTTINGTAKMSRPQMLIAFALVLVHVVSALPSGKILDPFSI